MTALRRRAPAPAFHVVHAAGSRLRLRVPGLGHDPAWQAQVRQRLRDSREVRSFRLNGACDSVAIEYRGAMPDLQRLLRRAAERKRAVVPAEDSPPAHPQRSFAFAALGLLLAAMTPARALAQLSLVASSLPIWRRALGVLSREQRLNVDFLDGMALATTLARRQPGTGALMAALVHLGDWVREHTARRSRRQLRQYFDLRHVEARLLARDGALVTVPAKQLRRGERVLVLAGDLVPADGIVVDGTASVDQRQMTGESVPATCERGTAVYAGSSVVEGTVTVEITAVGRQTSAARLGRLVEATPLGDTRIQNYAERFADRLVAPMFGANVLLLAATRNVDRFVSLAIVDYGTGIRVAAPTSVLTSMARAARDGVLIKGGRQIEQLAKLRGIAFDKTGTLTRGVLAVQSVRSFARGLSPEQVTILAAAPEAHLKHPIARALAAQAQALSPDGVPACEDVDYAIGFGVAGTVAGRRVHVGSQRYLRGVGIALGRAHPFVATAERAGDAVLLVAVDGELAGAVALSDEIRPDAQQVLAGLRQRGVRDIVMLTGDREPVARRIAAATGIREYHAEILPEDKATIIAQLRARGGPVAMVGDGVNDTAALAGADIGISVRGGADVARDAADVVLLDEGLAGLPRAIDLSRDALALVSQNFRIVAAANTLALGLSLPAGLLSPLGCTILSNGSAMVAALNSMRPLLQA